MKNVWYEKISLKIARTEPLAKAMRSSTFKYSQIEVTNDYTPITAEGDASLIPLGKYILELLV